jgi:hypothetical protein
LADVESQRRFDGVSQHHGDAVLVEAIEWMKEARKSAGDLEVLTLQENHKLNQNSCTILRRTTEYRPHFAEANAPRIHGDAVKFMHAFQNR